MNSVYYARIVRSVQVFAHEYLHRVATHDSNDTSGVAFGDLSPILLELTRGTYQNSTNWMEIPAMYLDNAATRAPAAVSLAPSNTATTAASTRTGGQSAVSSLTGASGQTENTRIVNPAPDAEFSAITLRPGGSRAVRQRHPPPNSDNGREMCVAWWTRGACYANCGRRYTHRPFSTPAERTRLMEYVQEHLAVPAGAAGNA